MVRGDGTAGRLSHLLGLTCGNFGIAQQDVIKKSRKDPLALKVRRVFSLAAQELGASLPEIASVVCRDHTTVMHSLRVAHASERVLAQQLAQAVLRGEDAPRVILQLSPAAYRHLEKLVQQGLWGNTPDEVALSLLLKGLREERSGEA